MKWNLIRLGGHAQGIVIKTLHKTLPRGVGVVWGVGGLVDVGGIGVLGV